MSTTPIRPLATIDPASRTWMKMIPRPIVGIRMVAIQNPFVRICWRYSRRMTARSFGFIVVLLLQLFGGRGREARLLDHLDEDLFQLGLRLDRGRKRDTITERVLDLLDPAVEELLRPIDQDDPVAQLLRLLEDVRRENHRLPLPLEVGEEVLEENDVHRVESGEGLVQDQHLRVVDDRP